MKESNRELQKIKGIGEKMARRFVKAGYDSPARVAEAGEEEIGKIRGVKPRMAGSIIRQAVEITTGALDDGGTRLEELKHMAAGVKERVQELALKARDRFLEETADPALKKVEKELVKIVASLDKVEGKLRKRPGKAGKGLAKAEKRLAAIADIGAKGVGRGLKKARKSLKRVYA